MNDNDDHFAVYGVRGAGTVKADRERSSEPRSPVVYTAAHDPSICEITTCNALRVPIESYSSLSLKIFYPDLISQDEIADYNDVFSLWHNIWIETRKEVDDTLASSSDSFSRQSEILVLYHFGKPIATCCHRYIDLSHKCTIYDSYFTSSIWPESVTAIVPSLGRTCLLGSHLFIDPNFRKSKSGLPIKNIVCSLSLAHANGTRPDVLLGMTRVDRGINKLFHARGAISLHANTAWHQIPVDLIALFPKQAPITIDPSYQEAVRLIGKTCERFTRNYFERKA